MNFLVQKGGSLFDARGNEEVIVRSSLASGKGIPARPFALLQPKDISDAQKVFERWMQKKMTLSGAAIPVDKI
jgi:hypothetical protein